VTSVSLASAGAAAAATVVAPGPTYAIVASGALGTGLANYDIDYVDGTLTVAPRALTITANDRSKPYGLAVTFAGTEFTTGSLVGSDEVTSVTLASAGAAASATVAAPGPAYAVVPSAAVGSGLGNYTLAYVNGTLTVERLALTITANDRTKTYGNTVALSGTEFTASGLINGDIVSSVTFASAGAAATATVAAPGPVYPIVPVGASGSGLGNYAIAYVAGTLTVTVEPRALTITASDRTKAVGETVTFDMTAPSPDFSVGGLVNADAVTGVTLTSAGADAAVSIAGSPYPIVPSAATGVGLANYVIGYVDGRLTVTEQEEWEVCVQYDPLQAHQRGSTIPLKMTLCDRAGTPLASPAVVVAVEIRRADGSTPMPATASGNSNPNGVFRSAGGGYIYNLKLDKAMPAGHWYLAVTVDGAYSTSYRLPFVVK
jgi:hypothetical protein